MSGIEKHDSVSNRHLETDKETEVLHIRGHHVPRFALFESQDNPLEYAAHLARSSRWAAEWDRDLAEVIAGYFPDNDFQIWYANDTVGPFDLSTPNQFEMNSRDTYKRYIELPDDGKIELSGKPDDICKGCFIGEHCPLPRNTIGDQRYLIAFKTIAEMLHLSDSMDVTYEDVTTSDGKTHQSMNIKTTKNVVRQVSPHLLALEEEAKKKSRKPIIN